MVATDMPEAALVSPDAWVVNRFDPLSYPHWDAELAAIPDSSFFHSSAWASVLKNAYGYRPCYFGVRDSGRLQALLPLVEIDSWLTGRRGVALPFTDECSPLARDPDRFRCLYQEALVYARVRRWKYLECRGGRALFGNVPISASYFGHRLDLSLGESRVATGFDSSVKRALRKADQSGVTIEFSTELEHVRIFHRLLRKTRKRHGLPPQPFQFFSQIQRHILAKNKGWVVLARFRGKPVAGAVFFRFGNTAIYKYGASDADFQHLRANNLVMASAISRQIQEGATKLDFGRTSQANNGLRKFKLGWGTEEYAIDYFRDDLAAGGFVAAKDASVGWHTRLFRYLPDPLSRLVGKLLYKHVA